jgi:hypothetical protein
MRRLEEEDDADWLPKLWTKETTDHSSKKSSCKPTVSIGIVRTVHRPVLANLVAATRPAKIVKVRSLKRQRRITRVKVRTQRDRDEVAELSEGSGCDWSHQPCFSEKSVCAYPGGWFHTKRQLAPAGVVELDRCIAMETGMKTMTTADDKEEWEAK